MDALHAYVGQGVTFLTGAAVIYFYVGLIMNLTQAQISTSFGNKYGYAEAIQQAMSMIILLAVAVGAQPLSDAIIELIETAGGSGTVNLLLVGKGLAQMVITLVIGGSVFFMVVMVVYNGFMLNLAQTLGASGEVSQRIMTIFMTLFAGIITLVSVGAANKLIATIF